MLDLLYVVGALLGLDDLSPASANLEPALAALCAQEDVLACDPRWRVPGGGLLPDVLRAAALPHCESGEAEACAAAGLAELYTAAGVLDPQAPTWDAGLAHLDQACTGGVARACTERERVRMYLDPAKSVEAVNPAPLAALGRLCEAGEPTACLLTGVATRDGWVAKADEEGAKPLLESACRAGHLAACAPVRPAAEDAALCAAGSLWACRGLVTHTTVEGGADPESLRILGDACRREQAGACGRIYAYEHARGSMTWLRRVELLARSCEASRGGDCSSLALLLHDPDRPALPGLLEQCQGGDGAACYAWVMVEERQPHGEDGWDEVEGVAIRGCDAGFLPACKEGALWSTQPAGLTGYAPNLPARFTTACRQGSGRACQALASVSAQRGFPWLDAVWTASARSIWGKPYPWSAVSGSPVIDVRPSHREAPSYPPDLRGLHVPRMVCTAYVRIGADGVPLAALATQCPARLMAVTEAVAMKWLFFPIEPAQEVGFDVTFQYQLK